jgi:hypothetical protein
MDMISPRRATLKMRRISLVPCIFLIACGGTLTQPRGGGGYEGEEAYGAAPLPRSTEVLPRKGEVPPAPAPQAKAEAQPQAAPQPGQAAPQPGQEAPEPPLPPAVFTGNGELVCNISARGSGRQILTMNSGNGLAIDAIVRPIEDGTVTTKGPDKGGVYRFTSGLAKLGKGTLAGVGDIVIEELETRVTIELKRYKQAGGPGTELSFTAADMADRGIYVEFIGRGRSAQGDRYAFRVNLGRATSGSGKVLPANPSGSAPIQTEILTMVAPIVTSVSTTSIQHAP